MDEFVEAIDEQIEDDNKIVTFKSLSFSLALPMQKSKEVLTEYFQAKKDTSLTACYLLTGKTKTGIQIKLVHYDELEEEKGKFERLISSHIYSVQKNKLKTSADLYNADYDAIKAATQSSQKYGVISYAGSKQLTAEEISTGRAKMQENRGKKDENLLHKSFAKPTTTKTKTPTQKKNAFSLFTPKTSSKSKATEEDKVKEEVKEAEEKEVKKESPNATETASNEKAKPKEKVGSKSSAPSSSSAGKKKKTSTSNMMKFMSKDKTDPFAASSQKSSVKKEKTEPPKETKKKTTTDEETKKSDEDEEVDFLDDVLTNLSNTKSPPKPRTGRGMLFMDDSDEEEEEEEEVKIESPKQKKKKKEAKISSPKKEKKEAKVDSPKKEPKKKTVSETKKDAVKRKKKQVSEDSDDEMSISINEIKKKSKIGGQSVKKSTKSKKKEKKPAAKRSRIVTNSSSSESEEEKMSVEEEEPEAATPVKPRGPVIKVGDKCKKRVLKSRTYVDADGSMLTEKVYEEVSCSDDDDENKDVIPATPEPVKKPLSKPPPKKNFFTKQTSLKSFFTKK